MTANPDPPDSPLLEILAIATMTDIVDRAADALDVPMHLTYREIQAILTRAVVAAYALGGAAALNAYREARDE